MDQYRMSRYMENDDDEGWDQTRFCLKIVNNFEVYRLMVQVTPIFAANNSKIGGIR